MTKRRILIHPDIFYSAHSGAIAAREAVRQLTNLEYEVGVFTHDSRNTRLADYPYYPRIPYTGTANYLRKKYAESFQEVISDFRPDYVFFIGGIVNTPVVYLDLCVRHGIKTVFLLLVQDFYCARLHAGLGTSSCTRCLTGSNLHAFMNNCGDKQQRPLMYLLNYQVIQKMFLPRLNNLDYILGSSEEQLKFYQETGITRPVKVKIPLFFDQKRVGISKHPASEPFFVILGQYRHEKGIHLISKILDHLREGITIKLLLYNDGEAQKFMTEYPANQKHIDSGKLQVLPGVTMTSGAVELIASSAGVINPSIWATTTEFVFLEVLGLSKPVITFKVGIHKEVIVNRVNGICVNAGDFSAMADEIHNLADHPELGRAIGAEAKKLYHQLTDESSFTEILSGIFK